MRTVGILGGMGPQATVLLMNRVIAAAPASDDADHVPLIVHQNPAVPSRIKRLIDGGGEDPGPVLAQMARDLHLAGAQALAMPCNTAHAYAPEIIAATPLPFLDIRQATIAALPHAARVGMLASPAVKRIGVFDAVFAHAGLTPIWPEDPGPVLALIRSVKAGDTGDKALADLRGLAAQLAKDCDHLLIACTELSLLTEALPAGGWTDSLDSLVASIMSFAKGIETPA